MFFCPANQHIRMMMRSRPRRTHVELITCTLRIFWELLLYHVTAADWFRHW